MKRIITLILFLFITTGAFAQTDGITYQAIIIGPDALELPGVDSEGNYLPTTDVTIKFSIIAPGSGVVEFTEIQNTTTDDFGRINLIIGAENHDDFEKIDWNGDPKSLKVEVDFNNGDGFTDMSIEKLTYVPYVAHRDITASGTLEVDDNTLLNGELQVNGVTNLGSTLNVLGNNTSNLTGDLNVDGETNLNNTLNVTGQSVTNLSGALNVGDPLVGPPDGDPLAPTTLNGSLTVVGESTFTGLVADDLTINNSTELNGSVDIISETQVTITSSVHTGDISYTSTNNRKDQVIGDDPGEEKNNYPLLVKGSTQGIAIEVIGTRRNGNNFVSFWDKDGQWGRIEGEIPSEFGNNADYLFDQTSLIYDTADATMDLVFQGWDTTIAIAENVAAATAFAPCVGPIPCVMGPPPSWIVSTKAKLIAEGIKTAIAIANEVVAIRNLVVYNENKDEFKGVTYASGAGDYAEYLMRADNGEKMTYGDIIGVKGGKISKNLEGAERIMVVSYKPIVLGNMPQQNKEMEYEKVAFMGQVPVKVYGKANIGDYIIPSGKNDGIGIAIHPSKIKVNQIKDIVGTAWGENGIGFNLINVAVGLNRNDSNLILENLEAKVNEQANEINHLKSQIEDILSSISNLEQGGTIVSKTTSGNTTDGVVNYQDYSSRKLSVVEAPETDIIYFEITKQDLEEGLVLAEKMMKDSGQYEKNKEIFDKLKNDSAFKERFITDLQIKLDKQIHYHKEIDKKGDH